LVALEETEAAPSYASAYSEALALHNDWLISDGMAGQPGDFSGMDLRDCDFSESDLRSTRFVRSNLSGVSFARSFLEGADFTEANLSGANLEEANLRDVRFCNANLEGARLAGATFLQSAQLCGCKLSHATLPPKVEFYGLDQARHAASRLAVQFITLLTVCVYAFLTIGSTKDVDLLTNARSVSFPFINISLPIVGFYLLLPIILPALAAAFYVNLSTYWDHLSTLPAFFPDGSELTRRTPPSLLDRLVELHMFRLEHRRSTFFSRLYASLVGIGLFGMVPAALFACWLRYLPRHDAVGITLQLTALLISLVYAWFLNLSMKSKLRMTSMDEGLRSWWQLLVLLTAWCLMAALSMHVLHGPMFGRYFYADLADQVISLKPKDAAPAAEGETSVVLGANLAGMNLCYANLAGSFAENSDFSHAQLESASLDSAVLRNAYFRGADLRKARMRRAQLRGADLRNTLLGETNLSFADLSKTNLTRAVLRGTNLLDAKVEGANFSRAKLLDGTNAQAISGASAVFSLAELGGAQLSRAQLPAANFFLADLHGAHLWRADLHDATFLLADLSGTNLTEANLTGADLSQATAAAAVLENATLVNAKLVCAKLYDAELQGADLTHASLASAQFRGADLRGARMTNADVGDASFEAANLDGADLRGVDLSKATGLTAAQLARAKTDRQTRLPEGLRP